MHKEVVRWGWSSVVALCKAISFTQRVFLHFGKGEPNVATWNVYSICHFDMFIFFEDGSIYMYALLRWELNSG